MERSNVGFWERVGIVDSELSSSGFGYERSDALQHIVKKWLKFGGIAKSGMDPERFKFLFYFR